MQTTNYKVINGPEGYLPPAAASMGVVLPDEGEALFEGKIMLKEEVMKKIAVKLLEAKNPTFFPGPLVLWAWNEKAIEKAKAVKELAEIVGAKIIPMPDYRPKYPMINPEEEINPNHPNLTIWHNKIDVCVFVGVHCHYANLALKIIRGGTNCYTIALCGNYGHEDAMISLRDIYAEEVRSLTDVVKSMKKGGK
ncbi:MAG: carbon monoxide dehydrogenase [Candidatus Omnitrophica bacterium]|nr:carbon monoxide dehydrogenase [Candidatus Omnitrophota bacterium]MBU0878524.1 carbon monoxide dehydrogenase [Candidatus Omnitrophota bacterium]MBU0896549.1 carbon monoxide dehydrogenase [Candidatus Omnitrophota bacterium]MBU1133453.1 carbon monoxide dehydrogenase [Candidatus Omnitrophota bacterium]MBU1366844.1 carbon monoxide dehydrogenase [Candidatus Omnitrophota bacterium]